MAKQRRVFRVAEKIRTVLANELIQVADPRFQMVTVTSVVVTPDLRLAKIYWTVSGDKERIEGVQEAFNSAGRLFRRAVGADLDLKFVPELKFYYDDTLDTVEDVERLFQRINNSYPKDS